MTKAILAIITLLAVAASATAATTVAGSKSNHASFKSTTIQGQKSSASSYKACVDGRGTVKADAKGNKDCTPKK